MICSQCRNIIREDSLLCPYCGAERGKSDQAAEKQDRSGQLYERELPGEPWQKAPEGRQPKQRELPPEPWQKAPEEGQPKQRELPSGEPWQKAPEGEQPGPSLHILPEIEELQWELPEFEPAEEPAEVLPESGKQRVDRGAERQAEAVNAKKHKRKKRICIAAAFSGAAAMVFFILLIIYLRPDSGKGKWKLTGGKNALFVVSTEDGEDIIIAGDGKVLEGPEKFYDLVSPNSTSMDREELLLIGRESRRLYLVTRDEWLPIDTDVTLAALSSSGDGMVYATEQDGRCCLYLYDVKKQTSKQLTNQLRNIQDLVISVDGKSAACLYSEGAKRECRLFLDGGEDTKIFENIIPIAISSGANYFYYIKTFITGVELFCSIRENGAIRELGKAEPLIFNEERTQLLYNLDSKLYLFENGENTGRIVSPKAADRVILPDNVQLMYESKQTLWGECPVRSCAAETLGGLVYLNGAELYYISKDMDAAPIAACSDCRISEDGKSLLYLSSGALYRIRDLEGSLRPERVVEGLDILQFISDGKQERIYYQKRHGELMFLKENGEPETLYNDKIESWAVANGRLYFIGGFSGKAGILYMLEDGAGRKEIAKAKRLERYGEKLYFRAPDDKLFLLDN